MTILKHAEERALLQGSTPRSGPKVSGVDAAVYCYECGHAFASHADLINHAHRSHSYVTPARGYAVSNTCLACLTMFGSRDALIQHYYTAGKCLDLLQCLYLPLDRASVVQLDQAAISLRKSGARCPPARKLLGPRLHSSLAGDSKRVLTLGV